MVRKCIQCGCKITLDNLAKTSSEAVVHFPVWRTPKTYLCRACAKCVMCNKVCVYRPVQKLKYSPSILYETTEFSDYTVLGSAVTVCQSLPFICPICRIPDVIICPFCKKQINGEWYHNTCTFLMICRKFDTIFSAFPKDILKYILMLT